MGENTRNIQADYNLCLPKAVFQGVHGVTGDPRFVDATKGVLWLRADSPAIGKGSVKHAMPVDFWDRPRPQNQAPDLGAFAFEPSLIPAPTRAGWDGGWAYHRHGTKTGARPVAAGSIRCPQSTTAG